MKIKALEAEVGLRFTLPDEELRIAANRLRKRQRQDKKNNQDVTDSRRKVSVFKNGEISYSGSGGDGIGHSYHVRFDYSPSVDLTWRLVESDTHDMRMVTDLPLTNGRKKVTPSGLRDFTSPWSYAEGSIKLKRNRDSPEKKYIVGLKIWGFLEDKKHIRKLRSLTDSVYLPIKVPQKGGSRMYKTRMPHSGIGGSMPHIVLNKRFEGDIDREAEQRVQEFYDSVLEFVLDTKVTTGFRHDDYPEKTLGELELERSGYDVQEQIANARASKRHFYAPSVRIDAYQPTGHNNRPELRWNGKKYVRENRAEIMCLTTFGETIMSPGGE